MRNSASRRSPRLFGQPAPCANNARVTINGQSYGLFANEEHVGGGFIKRVFPEAPNGDLFAGGYTPKTNELAPNKAKLKAFWAAHDIASMAAVIDLESSVTEWAAEALINEGDGYWGGAHNLYLYDYPGLGYRWLIDDDGRVLRLSSTEAKTDTQCVDEPLRGQRRAALPDRHGRSDLAGALHRGAADPTRALGRRAPARLDRTRGRCRSPMRRRRIHTACSAWKIIRRRSRRRARSSSTARRS